MTAPEADTPLAPVSARFIKTATWMLDVAQQRRWLAADEAAGAARRQVFAQGAEWLTNFSGVAIRERTRLVGVNLALSDPAPPPVSPPRPPADDYAIPPTLAVAFARAVAGAIPGWDVAPDTAPAANAAPLFADDFLERATFLMGGLRDVAGPDAEGLVERLRGDPETARAWAWNEDGGFADADSHRLRAEVQHTILLAIDRLDLLAAIIQAERDRLLLQQ